MNDDIPDMEKLDKPVCECCSFGREMFEERERKNIEEYGWLVHFVSDEPGCPFRMNIHTHGLLENFNHTDLQICAPIGPEIAHGILINLVDLIKKGITFEPRKEYSGEDIIECPYSIYFAEAEECGRLVLRLIIPDSQNRILPGEITGSLAQQWDGIKHV